MTAAFALHTLSKIMPRDAIVVEEAPSHRNDSYRYLPIRMSEGFYTGAAGCLGWSLPAAVGIALAHRSRKVIAVLGDGSSLYNIQGLWTAVQHRLPVTFLILNNAGYGALKWFGATLGVPEAPGVDVPGVDFGSIARGFGCAAQRVDRAADLSPALRQAISSNEPYLLDIQVGGAVHEIH